VIAGFHEVGRLIFIGVEAWTAGDIAQEARHSGTPIQCGRVSEGSGILQQWHRMIQAWKWSWCGWNAQEVSEQGERLLSNPLLDHLAF